MHQYVEDLTDLTLKYFFIKPIYLYQSTAMDNACFVSLLVSNRTTRFQHDTTRSTLSCAGGREDSQHRGNPGSVMIPRASGPASPGQHPRKMFSPPGPEQGHSSVTAYSAPDYCLQFTSGNYEGVQCGASLHSLQSHL